MHAIKGDGAGENREKGERDGACPDRIQNRFGSREAVLYIIFYNAIKPSGIIPVCSSTISICGRTDLKEVGHSFKQTFLKPDQLYDIISGSCRKQQGWPTVTAQNRALLC